MGIMALKNAAHSATVFRVQLVEFSDYVKDEVTSVGQHIALFAWKSLVTFTPKLSGRAKASWNFAYDSPDNSVPSVGEYSDPTPPSLRGPKAKYNHIYISSSLIYMPLLEDGYSSKGEKMVEKTINLVEFIIPTIIGGRQNV